MSQYFHNAFIFSHGKFWFNILLFILYKCYLHNIFITNSRLQVVNDFKIDPRLISLFLSINSSLLSMICCENIVDLTIFYLIYKKLRSQQLWKYYGNNKCYNNFTKHLFSVVVGHSLIFYYFISTYKKLTPQ